MGHSLRCFLIAQLNNPMAIGMKRHGYVVVFVLALAIGGAVCLFAYLRKTPIERQLDRVVLGMKPNEVEAILGERFGPVDTEYLGSHYSGDSWNTAEGMIFVIYEDGQVIEKGWVSARVRSGPIQWILDSIYSLFR